MAMDDPTAVRLGIFLMGYRPVPILRFDSQLKDAGKRPVLLQWQEICARADEAEIRRWSSDHECLNTGVMCGRPLIGLDEDIPDKDLAAQIDTLRNALLPPTPLVRIGKAPKSLRVFRAEGIHRKISTPALILPSGVRVQIEALGDGNQFVGFGTHPETKQPYTWPVKSPLDVPLDEVPILTAATLRTFLAAAEGVMRAAGGRTEVEIRDASAPPHKPRATTSDRNFPPTEYADVESALAALPNTHDWAGWVKIGAAVFDALADDGEELFAAWSAKSPRDDPRATRDKWRSFRRSPMTDVSERTLFHEARSHGWKPQRERGNAHAPEQDNAPPPDHPDDPGYQGADAEPNAKERAEDEPLHGEVLFPLVWIEDIKPVLDAQDFVAGVLSNGSLTVVYGESAAGKTFWVTDLSLHVAAGKRYCGRRVDQGGVVYCVLEGGNGFLNRVSAWKAEHKVNHIPFAAIKASINLLDPDAHTSMLISTIKAAAKERGFDIKLVVIDTLSRAMFGGNENAPEDMGALVINADRIIAETGACVVFIHHCGKDAARGARGHSLLRAALVTEIEVVVANEQTGGRIATVVKQRDMAKAAPFGFQLESVVLGQNQHGEDVTTCLVHSAAVTKPPKPLSDDQKLALDNLIQALTEEGVINAIEGFERQVVAEVSWRQRYYKAKPSTTKQETKRQSFRRAVDDLLDAKRIGYLGGVYWLP